MTCRKYTWANYAEVPTYEKLDRILVTTEWEQKDVGNYSDNARQHVGSTNSSSSSGAINDSSYGYHSPRDHVGDSSGSSAGDHCSP